MGVVTPVVKTVPHVYGYPLNYPYTYLPAEHVAPETKTVSGLTGVKAVPHVYGHHLTYAGLPTVHHLGKREAEAEAEADPYDPYYGYTGYPTATYTYGVKFPFGFRPYWG